jgi:anhydro-N-acetylmuramic acid kinase
MSGTSFDGIDVSLIETDGDKVYSFLGNSFFPYPSDLKKAYHRRLQFNVIELLDFEKNISELHCQAILNFCSAKAINLKEIDLIGFHGQTIYHNPNKGVSLQVGNSNIITQKLKIDVISDFRRRDIEDGGQGAPLVPFYHRAIIDSSFYPVAVVNIGGISNFTLLDGKKLISAADSGPGNALLDDLISYYDCGMKYDLDGQISSRGIADNNFVTNFLNDEYFISGGKKSLDREYFSFEKFICLGLENGAATICEVIAKSILLMIPEKYKKILVCGGGRKNSTIINRLAIISNAQVDKIDNLGLDGDYIESQAFAFLAARIKYNLPISSNSTTGCFTQPVGGAFYRA